ncbi:MAG: hypothetical protein EOP88_20730 [Verrucomicrobiaceae bacterium]|nr:MAG: hypothetical protein EOP88_20730 [Verrucomicrobiaceae bacterium]
MKTLAAVFLSAFAMVPFAVAEPLQKCGTWFFSVPTKEVEAIRALQRSPEMAKDADFMNTTLRKRAGVEMICDWWLPPLWDDQEKTEEKKYYHRDIEPPARLDAWLTHRLKTEDGVGLQSLKLNCATVTGSSVIDSFRFICDTGALPVFEDRWRELGAWEEGGRTWLMWQRFPEITGQESGAPDGSQDAGARKKVHSEANAALSVTAELLFYQATPGEVAQLSKAGPESREKAAEWLMARGLLWHKVRIYQRLGPEKRNWHLSHDRRGTGDSDKGNFKKVLNLDVAGNRAGDVLSMEMDVGHVDGDYSRQFTKGTFSLEKVTPAWNFALSKDCGKLTAVVYREVKE